jgi:hypothetical protein
MSPEQRQKRQCVFLSTAVSNEIPTAVPALLSAVLEVSGVLAVSA